MDVINKLWVWTLFVFLILSFGFSAQADVIFKDIPDNHWAADSVYKLVKMGVTSGFPDGTFRGKQKITRYGIASMLARLADKLAEGDGVEEKLIAELRSEVALIKYKREKAAKDTQFSGEFQTRGRLRPYHPYEGKGNYRLKLALKKVFDENSSLRLRFDTVDAGFNSATQRDFATKLIDIESKFKSGGVDYRVVLGPGIFIHTEPDGFSPSENNRIYIRPKTAAYASKRINNVKVTGAYVTRQVQTSGSIGAHELNCKLAFDFKGLDLYMRPRYMFVIDGRHDCLIDVGGVWAPLKWVEIQGLFSVGDFSAGNSGMYVKLIKKLKNILNTKTNVTFRFDKVGSKYRDNVINEYEFIYLNGFDRLILDGTVDVGLKIDHQLDSKLKIEWKGDYVTTGAFNYGANYPETYFLWQAGFYYAFTSDIELNGFYRMYNVPSKIAQFNDTVPDVSDLIGLKVTRKF
jgi:S-layer homology domain